MRQTAQTEERLRVYIVGPKRGLLDWGRDAEIAFSSHQRFQQAPNLPPLREPAHQQDRRLVAFHVVAIS
jgi:hypothetical protein